MPMATATRRPGTQLSAADFCLPAASAVAPTVVSKDVKRGNALPARPRTRVDRVADMRRAADEGLVLEFADHTPF